IDQRARGSQIAVFPRWLRLLGSPVRPVGPGRERRAPFAGRGDRTHAATVAEETDPMTVALPSGSIAFRPRARLLKLIGAELISDDVVAVTELVKNAYDADASRVTISFHSVTAPGGEITITDDGSGMDVDTVLGVWMEPGATSRGWESRRTRRR